mgnify:CR=1 FL=1
MNPVDIDIDKIDIHKIDNLEEFNDSLNKLKYEFISKVHKIEKMTKKVNILIAKNCEKEGHKWITEREEGPYGERFTYCEKCRCDSYDYSYRH